MARASHLSSVSGGGGSGSRASYQGVLASGDDYDPNAFYAGPASNEHDHSYTLKQRIHPSVATSIETLLASGALGGTPINSMGAVIRDALVHWMHKISKLVDDDYFLATAEDERRRARAAAIVAEREYKQRIIEDARNGFKGARDQQDVTNTRELVELYEPMIENLREPYKTQLEGILKDVRAWLKSVRKTVDE